MYMCTCTHVHRSMDTHLYLYNAWPYTEWSLSYPDASLTVKLIKITMQSVRTCICISYAQTSDSDNPRIVLCKARIQPLPGKS